MAAVGAFSLSTGECIGVWSDMTIRANGEQVPPLVVPNVSFSAGSSSITVSWDSVSGADTYEVFGKMLAGCYPSYRTSLAITSNTSWINNDVILGFEYDHYINPCNAAGCANPDAIIGSSPIYSAPCHVNCTSHSQCTIGMIQFHASRH